MAATKVVEVPGSQRQPLHILGPQVNESQVLTSQFDCADGRKVSGSETAMLAAILIVVNRIHIGRGRPLYESIF